MRIVIVGAGIAGLGCALALSRDGHEVTVLERDATPMPTSPDEAFEWVRRGAPQVRHSHAMLARLRNLLRDRAPDVLQALLDAGATEMHFTDNLPDTLTDRDARPGDEELVALACRRTTFEWVLRSAVLREPDVEIVDGAVVSGLIADASDRSDESDVSRGPQPAAPRVVGVRASERTYAADLVIDATGPRSSSAQWLAAIGVEEPVEDLMASEIVYFSRFYRLEPGAQAPEAKGPIGGDLGYLKYAVFVGDNRTFSLTLAVDSDDEELRAAVGTVEGFEAAAAQLVAAQPWIDGRSVAITPVHVMAGLRNRKRHFTRDGEAIVTGFAAVGDASVCTNPLYGRGCSLALVHAFGAADLVREHGEANEAFVQALAAFTEHALDPWFKAAVQQDREAIEARGAPDVVAGATTQPDNDGFVDPKAWARDVFREGLLPATRTSPEVFRAFLRWFNLLATPDALMTDTAVIAAALESYQARDQRPVEVPLGPATRSDFVRALADR